MNRVFLAGVVSKAPLFNETSSNIAALSFELCVKESWVEKSGREILKTTFVKCVQYGKSAEATYDKIKEGDRILLEGSLIVIPDSGMKTYRHEVKIQTIESWGK